MPTFDYELSPADAHRRREHFYERRRHGQGSKPTRYGLPPVPEFADTHDDIAAARPACAPTDTAATCARRAAPLDAASFNTFTNDD